MVIYSRGSQPLGTTETRQELSFFFSFLFFSFFFFCLQCQLVESSEYSPLTLIQKDWMDMDVYKIFSPLFSEISASCIHSFIILSSGGLKMFEGQGHQHAGRAP